VGENPPKKRTIGGGKTVQYIQGSRRDRKKKGDSGRGMKG